MSDWQPLRRKREFSFNRLFLRLFVPVALVVIAWARFGPEDVHVTARSLGATPCDVTIAGQCARQLAPTTTVRATTTTKARIYGPDNPTDYLLVVDGQVTRIPRNQTTNLVVQWLQARGL